MHTEVTDEMLSYIDRLVDGEFVEAKKDVTLKFRGSRNQRILYQEETETGKRTGPLWPEYLAFWKCVRGKSMILYMKNLSGGKEHESITAFV